MAEDEGSAILATSILASFRPLSSLKRLAKLFSSSGSRKYPCNGSSSTVLGSGKDLAGISHQKPKNRHSISSPCSICDSSFWKLSIPLNGSKTSSQCLATARNEQLESEAEKLQLVKFNDVPAYLQFNQYVLKGYRPPNQSVSQCLRSLTYFHNETINILTHVISMVIFGLVMPYTMPWDEIKHPVLAYTCLIGSVSSWVGSSMYHLFMNHHRGESLYITLLQWDVTGIWVTQAIGASTTIYASVVCYNPCLQWSSIAVYALTSAGALRDCLLARSAWSRILGFGTLFFLRIIAFILRLVALGPGAGSTPCMRQLSGTDVCILALLSTAIIPFQFFVHANGRSGSSSQPDEGVCVIAMFMLVITSSTVSIIRLRMSLWPYAWLRFLLNREQFKPLIHIVMQELWAVLGSVISATRVPERWFPGKFDYILNSHNLMHVFVVFGAFHMIAAAKADLLWLNQDRCS